MEIYIAGKKHRGGIAALSHITGKKHRSKEEYTPLKFNMVHS
jgi:hypothetical protein